jgi:type 1 fimbriae regulatory protein FimB/type 1 fimbriae regulatory protein FimE
LNKQRARKRAIPAVPTIVKRKVPRRRPNSEYRNREYLSEKEVGEVIAAAATQGRHGLRDSTMILIGYRHGLRVAELVSLRWDQIDFAQGLVHVSRLKNGLASVHPLRGPELRALRRLQREEASATYVFVSERKAPLTIPALERAAAHLRDAVRAYTNVLDASRKVKVWLVT